jgi:hypothetical protein
MIILQRTLPNMLAIIDLRDQGGAEMLQREELLSRGCEAGAGRACTKRVRGLLSRLEATVD